MIVLDIETSGLTGREGIWQIGALELENPENYVIGEAKIDEEDNVEESALKVTGKTEEQLRDSKKQTQKELIREYFSWLKSIDEKIFLGENVGWDISMIQDKCIKFGMSEEFRRVHSQRSFDLHTISQLKFKELKGKYYLDENGKSKMNLPSILEFCGIPDERVYVKDNKVTKEGKPHDAPEDCKLEG